MISISPEELQELLKTASGVFLLDVREPFERELFHIGGTLIPLGDLLLHLDEIPDSGTAVVYCRKGIRSQIAIQRLEQRKPGLRLVNLKGGMDAWQRAALPPAV
jgi:rhodanese-related sulfurtransferase